MPMSVVVHCALWPGMGISCYASGKNHFIVVLYLSVAKNEMIPYMTSRSLHVHSDVQVTSNVLAQTIILLSETKVRPDYRIS
jgi:hypothetical protein